MMVRNNEDSSDIIAMVVEVLFGLFGLLGVGWLYAGKFSTAMLMFLGFFVLVFIEAVALFSTIGLATCVIIPLNLAIAVISGVRCRDYVRNSDAQVRVINVILGLTLIGSFLCVGLSVLSELNQ